MDMYICMCVQIYVFMYIALRKNYEEDKYHIKDRVLLNFLFNLEKVSNLQKMYVEYYIMCSSFNLTTHLEEKD